MRRTGLSLLATLLLACGAGQPTAAQSGGLFAYDATRPLDVREQGARESGGVRAVELTYASPKGGRVPATLVLPAGEGPFPAVVFQHGGGDARRGERPEIDGERIALVGHSYGGVLAGIVAGVDARLAAVVVMAAPGRITDPLREEGRRQRVPARRLARYLAAMRAVDAVAYVGRASAPLYFQYGRLDTMPAAWFRAYVAAAPRGSRVKWYPAGHGLCDCATRDRRAWLKAALR